MELARTVMDGDEPALKNDGFRQKLADWYVQAEGLKFTRFRTMTALSRGETPGPESSIGKIISANQLQDLSHEAMELEDQFGIIVDSARSPRWRRRFSNQPCGRRACASPAAPMKS